MQRIAENLVFTEAPRIIGALNSQSTRQDMSRGMSRGLGQGIKFGFAMVRHIGRTLELTTDPDAFAGGAAGSSAVMTAGRPVTGSGVPAAQRARKLVYAADLGGRADSGEIVWAWVAHEDDPDRGEDRPVLVVGRDGRTLLALMLSGSEPGADDNDDDNDWVGIGPGGRDDPADTRDGQSWVRLDRVLDVPEEGIRREGAVLNRDSFREIATRLRTDYSWR